jgi:hypothetical protein
MPELSRRRSRDVHRECWHIFYDDVRVGTITERAGVPHDVDQWGWQCGFYPLTHRGEHAEGTAASFEQARADFVAAWTEYLPKCAPTDFEEYRRQRARRLEICNARCRCEDADAVAERPVAMLLRRGVDISSADRHVYEAHMTELRL